jgi:CubicO group peptidase (beta-lactamase class C family)
MKKFTFILLLLSGFLFASNSKTLESKVDTYLAAYQKAGTFQGSVLIAQKGKILFMKGYGFANEEFQVPNGPQTKFHLASITKPFTATAVLLLREKGLLRLDDTLAKYIPDYPKGDKILIEHLMGHKSGIPNVNSFPDYDQKALSHHDLPEIISWYKDKPLEFEPGSKYSYSNSNYNLLAYIIEKVSGKDYGTFLRENIFSPLEMNATDHDGDPKKIIRNLASGYIPVGTSGIQNAPFLDWSIKTGNGSVYSTILDMYKWDRALYGNRILPQVVLQEMFDKGYGWFSEERFGHKRIYYNGRSPGFNSSFDRFINDDLCIIVLANNYSAVVGSISRDLSAMMFGQPYEIPEEIKPVQISASALQRLAGKYEFGEDFYVPGAFEIRVIDQKLFIVREHFQNPLITLSETRFFSRDYWASIEFTKDKNGKINGLVYRDHQEFHAKRLE